jgi:hypothetical protein
MKWPFNPWCIMWALFHFYNFPKWVHFIFLTWQHYFLAWCYCTFIIAQNERTLFFETWLLLQDKLNTRDRLRRRNMALDSYVCENCLLQVNESIYYLLLRCNIAKNCWASIGIQTPRINRPQRAVNRITQQLNIQRGNANHHLNVLEYLKM